MSMKNSKRNRPAKGTAKANSNSIVKSLTPPPLRTDVSVGHTFRFQAKNQIVLTAISNEDLLNLIFIAYPSGITMATRRALQAVRVKKITIWSSNQGVALNTVSIRELNTAGVGGPEKFVTDTALGVTDIAHISVRTRPNSLLGDWVPPNAAAPILEFELSCPNLAIVDVQVSLVFDNNLNSVPGPTLLSIGGAGLYYGYLDQSSTKLLVPVGAPFIL